jgi:hypothetical protein
MSNEQWTEESVADRFEEAVDTLRKLPAVRVNGYISAWPEIAYSKAEIAMMDRKPRQWLATPQAISDMIESCKWINLLHKRDDRKIIWLRASKTPWKQICTELGICRSTAHYKWRNAIRTITKKLNRLPIFTNH